MKAFHFHDPLISIPRRAADLLHLRRPESDLQPASYSEIVLPPTPSACVLFRWPVCVACHTTHSTISTESKLDIEPKRPLCLGIGQQLVDL